MTDEMLAEANANKAKAKVTNAEFLKGHIEEIPLPDKTIDVVISNCVINLSIDKDKVFKEIFRVLKPGGRIAISDIVTTQPLPDEVRENLMSWAGCISGALLDEDYKKKLTDVGFENIEIKVIRTYDLTDTSIQQMAPGFANEKNSQWNGALVSAFINAKKPAQQLIQKKDFSIKLAEQKDFVQIHDLLSSKGLPIDGVNPEIGEYYIASHKELMGVIGYEAYGKVVLLRSLAVKSQYQKANVARLLIENILKVLKNMNFTHVYLLTTTAELYLNRYGFDKTDRNQIPGNVLESSALGGACPSASTCMFLNLQEY